jgi:glutamyl-tRNA synthetase
MKDFEKKVLAYALKNAILHGGKANQGAVISSLFHEGLKKENMKKHVKEISKIISKVNKLNLIGQKKEFENLQKVVSKRKIREGLQELPNAKKGVVMRFAPSASGPWHIAHATTAALSFLYVEKYGGTFYVRIEDTNPENIYKPAYKMIKDEAKWLFKNKAKIIIQSDRINLYYKYAKKLINEGNSYVCECSGDEFRKYSKEKKNCPCRKLSISENKKRWEKMLNKKGYKEGQAVLRFKSIGGMKNKNPAMRDFPLARINLTKHPLTGNKYRVWPLMNLSVTVDDIELKMTHVIRGKDHRDNAERQKMIYKVLGKKFPWVGFLGRLKFKDLILSTTQFRKDIEAKKYSGWDDSKLPTLAALRKKDYKPEAFYKFAEQMGLSESDKVMNKKEYFYLLDSFNKK